MRFGWLALALISMLGCTRGAPPRQAAYVTCPPSTQWNGEHCVWRYVITDVRCPTGAAWNGQNCVSSVVSCPQGARWNGSQCTAPPPPAALPAPSVNTDEPPLDGTHVEVAADEARATEAKPGQPDDSIFDARTPLPTPKKVDMFQYP